MPAWRHGAENNSAWALQATHRPHTRHLVGSPGPQSVQSPCCFLNNAGAAVGTKGLPRREGRADGQCISRTSRQRLCLCSRRHCAPTTRPHDLDCWQVRHEAPASLPGAFCAVCHLPSLPAASNGASALHVSLCRYRPRLRTYSAENIPCPGPTRVSRV